MFGQSKDFELQETGKKWCPLSKPLPLHKIYENTGFHRPVFSRIVAYIFKFKHKHTYNNYIIKIKNTKTKIHITVVRRKATITPEIKLK